MKPIENPLVAKKFDGYPAPVRDKLLQLRKLIFETAAEIAAAGPIDETLKWGEPAYLTAATQSGSTHPDRLEAEDARPVRHVLQLQDRAGRRLQDTVSE